MRSDSDLISIGRSLCKARQRDAHSATPTDRDRETHDQGPRRPKSSPQVWGGRGVTTRIFFILIIAFINNLSRTTF